MGINAVITEDPDAPDESHQKQEFSELTPAVSTWVLEIPIKDNDGKKVIDTDDISDIEIWFYNYYYTR